MLRFQHGEPLIHCGIKRDSLNWSRERAMDTPLGHHKNADQIAYWNRAGRSALGRPAANPGRRAGAGRGRPVRSRRGQSRRTHHRYRLRGRRHHHCACRKNRAGRPRSRHRHFRRRCWRGRGRSRPRACRSSSCLRMRPCTSSSRPPSTFWRRGSAWDVFRRACAVVCQHAQGAEAIGPSGLRVLAGTALQSVFHGAAAGGLPTCAENFRPPGPEDPGPFAFASEARVNRVLSEAGFSGKNGAVRTVTRHRGGTRSRCRGRRRARNRTGEPRASGPSARGRPRRRDEFGPRRIEALRQRADRQAAAHKDLDRDGVGRRLKFGSRADPGPARKN